MYGVKCPVCLSDDIGEAFNFDIDDNGRIQIPDDGRVFGMACKACGAKLDVHHKDPATEVTVRDDE